MQSNNKHCDMLYQSICPRTPPAIDEILSESEYRWVCQTADTIWTLAKEEKVHAKQ